MIYKEITLTSSDLASKNLFKDYKTKTPYLDEVIDDYFYAYTPKYFDIDAIVCDYDVDEKNFSLMKAQHIIALIVGFNKWGDLLKASESELEFAKLLFDNQDKIMVEDWEMYISQVEHDHNTTYDAKSRIEIFKLVFLNENFENFQDYRLNKK